MKCPVCNKTGIPLDAKTCPECGSDLEAVVFISHLDANLRRLKKNLTIVAIVGAVTMIVLLVRIYMLYNYRTEGRIQVEKYQQENIQLHSTVDSLRNMIKTAGVKDDRTQIRSGEETKGEVKTHVVKSGDSLWKLAQQYLGDGNKFTKIASDNNLHQPYLLKEGQELKIISK